jgi:hypothetical protein
VDYRREVLDYRGDKDGDHVVIVFRSKGDWTVVYDPYKSLVPAARRTYSAYGNGVIPVRTTKFINYWKYASIGKSWMFWLSKLPKIEQLETYNNKPKEESVTI